MNLIEEFNAYRSKMNEKILEADNKIIKRIFNLDTNAFESGKIDKITKEYVGLSCSLVLRCDDCVRYHLEKCKTEGVTTEQIFEVMAIANLIGGTIVIPHLRRAVEFWQALQDQSDV
ncbi:MAG: carboxymuconolactone decarboxylase family protein [Candidatus Cyclobacteriaceae bacterium M3_2C_046]